MTDFAADDYASIAKRLHEIKCEPVNPADPAPPSDGFWCNKCGDRRTYAEVRYTGTSHDCIKCGYPTSDWCSPCNGGGWVEVYTPSPPCFGECPDCLNPHGNTSP